MQLALIALSLGLGAVACFASPVQDETRTAALKAVFADLEKGIKENSADTFKARWHAEGYEKNLTGGSGIPGKGVFGQGSRKKWVLKPDLAGARILENGAVVIVACDIWAWEKEKAFDKVEMVVVKDKDAYVVLGGGEKREEVDALASRWIKKEPLEAPKKD
ncbi:MAG TPA: hypothetical protein VE981_07050 [Planctomycetota bacterium]|nr:hypothetical protein [Planctomycetota bacterium]